MIQKPIKWSPGAVKFLRTMATPWRLGWSLANQAGWLGEAPVSDQPGFDPESLARWQQEIAAAKVYLEYGSGGSTVSASTQVKRVITVDNDAKFLDAVVQKVRQTPGAIADLTAIHVNIGLTEKWGRPVFTFPTPGRVASWRRYTAEPWEHLEAEKMVPDFICVDGRFRVACVFESLVRLPDGATTTIMLDDAVRSFTSYDAVLAFAEAERRGRALFLRRKADFDRERCLSALVKYQRDPE